MSQRRQDTNKNDNTPPKESILNKSKIIYKKSRTRAGVRYPLKGKVKTLITYMIRHPYAKMMLRHLVNSILRQKAIKPSEMIFNSKKWHL
jgi:hypothetical protein